MKRLQLLAVVHFLWLSGCAYQRPESFVRACAEAARATSAGRFAEAARAYDRAVSTTDRPLDRDEAVYRAGQAWRRSGDTVTALARFEWLARNGDDATRRTRGELEAVRIYFDRGQWDRAEQVAIEVAARQPSMGAGRRAIELSLIEADSRDQSGIAAISLIDRAWLRLSRTELAAMLDIERARRLVLQGQPEQAVIALERSLRWRYPQNPRWDDGSWELSQLLLQLNRPDQALAVINRALEPAESLALIPGSSVRPRFPQLALERGRVLETLGRLPEAATAYRAMYNQFAHSTLRDDALEQEARVLRLLGETARACTVDQQLARDFSQTRRGRAASERMRSCSH
ncbi:MAG: tetratricopeptide repeat protein [Deltaproteobacteria bacterium]|nr:tetratricopeptide repeat protein [Deltaproteobacteria bacterium]